MSNDPKTYEQGYAEGYVAGYGAGLVAGRGQGYSDAKYRAHRAVEAATVNDAHGRQRLLKAVVEIVGAER